MSQHPQYPESSILLLVLSSRSG